MRRFAGYVLLAAAVLAADQGTKALAQHLVGPHRFVSIAGTVLGLQLARNPGAAFSLFSSMSAWLTGVTLVAIGAIVAYSWRANHLHRLMMPALALELGGALGNLIDRLRFGYVVDFIYVSFWPTFNVADAAITVGAVLLCYCLLAPGNPAEPKADSAHREGKDVEARE